MDEMNEEKEKNIDVADVEEERLFAFGGPVFPGGGVRFRAGFGITPRSARLPAGGEPRRDDQGAGGLSPGAGSPAPGRRRREDGAGSDDREPRPGWGRSVGVGGPGQFPAGSGRCLGGFPGALLAGSLPAGPGQELGTPVLRREAASGRAPELFLKRGRYRALRDES